MPSTGSETEEKKGGRPPAVKAGGRRVVQHKRTTSETEKSEEEKMTEEIEKQEEEGSEELTEKDPSPDALAAAMYHKSDKDFPKDAINAYHVKPVPTKTIHSHQKPRQQQQIHQPRKE